MSAIVGVGAMLATRCLTWEVAAGALSPQVVMIIVASLALGLAMTQTGGALYIAQVFVESVRLLPTPFILSSLMLVMAILTNVVSNAAAGMGGEAQVLSHEEVGIAGLEAPADFVKVLRSLAEDRNSWWGEE